MAIKLKFRREDGTFYWRTGERARRVLVGAKGSAELEEEIEARAELFDYRAGEQFMIIPLKGVECDGTPRMPDGYRGDLQAIVGCSLTGGWNLSGTAPAEQPLLPVIHRDLLFGLGEWPPEWRTALRCGLDKHGNEVVAREEYVKQKDILNAYQPTQIDELVLIRLEAPPYAEGAVGTWRVGQYEGQNAFNREQARVTIRGKNLKDPDDYVTLVINPGHHMRQIDMSDPAAQAVYPKAYHEGWARTNLPGLTGAIGLAIYRARKKLDRQIERGKRSPAAGSYKPQTEGEIVYATPVGPNNEPIWEKTILALTIRRADGVLQCSSVDSRAPDMETALITKVKDGQQAGAKKVLNNSKKCFGLKWKLSIRIAYAQKKLG